MQYKTIALELIQEQYPALHERLLRERKLRAARNEYARELRTVHLAWMDEIRRVRPQTNPQQISSEALELAIEHLQGTLRSESQPDEAGETLSLDEAMAFITHPMPLA